MIQATERLITSKDGYTFVFLGVLFLLLLARALYGKRLVFANYFLFTKVHLLKDSREVKFGLYLILLGVSALTFGLLLFLIAQNYSFFEVDKASMNLYLFIVGAVYLYLLIANFVGKFIGNVLGISELANAYFLFKSSYLRTIVLFLLPLLLLVVYSPMYQFGLLKITVACTLVLLVLRTVFVLVNNKNLILNELFYFILYLCTLEIAPLVIILKLTI